jgi:GNAT superfamily N-acetyltransferase
MRGELQYLFVAPNYRRRGIATELIRLVADWFVEQGAAKVCVCVDADTPAAGPFYTARNAVPMRKFWVGWEDISVVPQ